MVLENHRKSLIHHGERSELHLHFDYKCPKWSMASFGKPEIGGQTVLPDRSVLLGQILVKSTPMKIFKWF